MSVSGPGKHVYLPWLRRGLASAISARDSLGTGVPGRANVPVRLRVNSEQPFSVPVRLYGPSDVTGIDPREVIRTDPPHLTTGFEPNYLPSIEFDDPSFPWMFTPAAGGDNERLRPWLCLVVVRANSSTLSPPGPSQSLPVLECSQSELPNSSEVWAWAHAQVTLAAGESLAVVLENMSSRTVSRLICPRRLEPNVTYRACVVPTFETGRRAGLGEALTAADEAELRPAWPSVPSAGAGSIRLPVYYHWEFTAGLAGDFESLVRALEVRPLPSRLGIQRIDVSAPGWTVPPIPRAARGSTLEMSGALRAPTSRPVPWYPAAESAFRDRVRTILNEPAESGRALVAPPIYGGEHARQATIPGRDVAPGWLADLNLDPRRRIAAGLGAQAVRFEQESLMASAWEQLAAHQHEVERVRRDELAQAVRDTLVSRRFAPLDTASLLQITEPAMRESGAGTPAAISAVRTPSKSAPTSAREASGGTAHTEASMPSNTRRGDLSGPVRAARAEAAGPVVSTDAGWLLARSIVSAGLLDPTFRRLGRAQRVAPLDPPTTFKPAAAASMGESDSIPAVSAMQPAMIRAVPDRTVPGTSSPANGRPLLASTRAVAHWLQSEGTIAAAAPPPAAPSPPRATAGADMAAMLSASPTLADARDALLDRLGAAAPDAPEPISFAPRFPQPAYQLLRGYFPEFLLPGLDQVTPNSVAVVQTDQAFIEAFLVGLNHEMGRELLWRGFPADRRATYFRNFWESPDGRGADQLSPIAEWRPNSRLGEHLPGVGGQGLLVLLIRGDLLRRYPRTIITAVEAVWVDGNTRRVPGGKERLPIFRGNWGLDVVLLGFPLTAAEARGSASSPAHPGWFFLFSEQPTEPRFGLDADPTPRQPATVQSWRDLSWGHLANRPGGLDELTHIPTDILPSTMKLGAATWARNGADLAAILEQQAFQVAIHASAWLS